MIDALSENLRDVAVIARSPGDVIVARTRREISDELAQPIQKTLRKAFPDQPILIVTPSVEIDVVSVERIARAIARWEYERYDSHHSMPGGMTWDDYLQADSDTAEAVYLAPARGKARAVLRSIWP
jgi:hypothetical protein